MGDPTIQIAETLRMSFCKYVDPGTYPWNSGPDTRASEHGCFISAFHTRGIVQCR